MNAETLAFLQNASRDLINLSRGLGGVPTLIEVAIDLKRITTNQILYAETK